VDEGRVNPSLLVMLAGHDIHIAALDGAQAACCFTAESSTG
jgi:hypothetical protein